MSEQIPILDTHQHLMYPEKWPYSWADDLPALAEKGFRYEDYVKLVEGTGITGTIFMETSPDDPHWDEEAGFVHELATHGASLIRGIIANCSCFASSMSRTRSASEMVVSGSTQRRY